MGDKLVVIQSTILGKEICTVAKERSGLYNLLCLTHPLTVSATTDILGKVTASPSAFTVAPENG